MRRRSRRTQGTAKPFTFSSAKAGGGGPRRGAGQSRGGGHLVPPRAWRGLVPRAAPRSRTKDKGRGRQPEGGRARKVRPISEGNANAAGAEGSPSLAACQRQGRSSARKAPLTLGKGKACGETAPAPYWVGAGAAAPKQVKRGKSFADETQQGRRLTPTTAATTLAGASSHLLNGGFGCPLDPFFLRGASQGLH